jgi:hypothetical protein
MAAILISSLFHLTRKCNMALHPGRYVWRLGLKELATACE